VPAVRLTNEKVKAVRPPSAGRLRVWDAKCRGLHLSITPGGAYAWVFSYRIGGVSKLLTLTAPGGGSIDARTMAVEQARIWADGLRTRVHAGENPSANRAARKTAVRMVEGVDAWLDEIAPHVKPGVLAEYRRLLARDVLPALGGRAVAEVTSDDVRALMKARVGRRTLANRVHARLRTFFGWCESRGLRAPHTNPCDDVKRYKERAVERFLSDDERRRLGDALSRAESVGLPAAPTTVRQGQRRRKTTRPTPPSARTPANPYAVAVLRFLLLSGWRESEALTLRWDAIDAERGFATLDDTKTGRSQRPLGRSALAYVESLPRVEGSHWVFPGANGERPLREIKRLWWSVRHAAGIPDVRLHDLRHTFAATAASAGESLPMIGAMLGHRDTKSTARYAHLAESAQRRAADDTSAAMAAALGLDA
jgi:integrase